MVKHTQAYYQDEQGNWWYRTKLARERAVIRFCVFCGAEFVTRAVQPNTHCSGTCSQSIGSPEQKERIKDLYNQGLSTKEIAKLIGIRSHQTVLNWLCELAIPIRKDTTQLVEQEIEQIIELFNSGVDETTISGKLTVPLKKVIATLRSSGLLVRSSRKKHRYIEVTVYPNDPYFCMASKSKTSSAGYVPLHRLVMARHVGRPLLREETVHHKNGNRHDNRLENLELWEKSHGAGQRTRDLVIQDFIRLPEEDRQKVVAQLRSMGY